MELKVWVEGIQRIVCGVSENTTCQDIVYALAHATGKVGRFTLIENWRNKERQLSPDDKPLKILTKWGEFSSDVHFILQCNSSEANKNEINFAENKKKTSVPHTKQTNPVTITNQNEHKIAGKNSEIIGVVKGVQQVRKNTPENIQQGTSTKNEEFSTNNNNSNNYRVAPPYKNPPLPPQYRPKIANYYISDKCEFQDSLLYGAQYRELLNLINYQKGKLSNQQADITKYDAEIFFWEGKEKKKEFQLEYLANEYMSILNIAQKNQEQIQSLNDVEKDCEIVKLEENTLKTDIQLLRAKLTNCETELIQCKNKIRHLIDDLQEEQSTYHEDSYKEIEQNLISEIERIQADVCQAKENTNLHHVTAETLKKEVHSLEGAIAVKKKELETLVGEMKEANLESLKIASNEDLKSSLFIDGTSATHSTSSNSSATSLGINGNIGNHSSVNGCRSMGSTRKMIGSPRQLENAAPTNKNPHGVWV